ncbi:enoyl-CoA hydratase-related protein [Planosporangium mesophilum]|uniref:Formyl transferase n=1 Tax=Planosporangium mesophilum TaxID=689768 RepID=A0A8J3X2R4_9ACTN|nr:enoyl-CoA hydratase-related protein [Planosporangium mesophilum]NJC83811.1 formyl transferase [Planosporangium mesophilum]GII25191.1 formyl transferase [Planosporangium mesophilum]
MKILLLVSSFNGLTQRAWCALREAGHEVSVELAIDESTIISGVEAAKPDLVLCPFLKERVPARVWQNWRTVIIHPGPVGDRGPSSLDYAIMNRLPVWGVTALQAVEEMDAGPIWATRTFPMPDEAPRKSVLYNSLVADAALQCIAEVVGKAGDPTFMPTPLEFAHRPVPGTGLQPTLRQDDRAFSWEDDAETIVRRVRAADGFPGVRTEVAGLVVNAFDAYPGNVAGAPGEVLAHYNGSVLVGTGRGSVWLGYLKEPGGVKLPATMVLAGRLRDVPNAQAGLPPQIEYARHGDVGTLTFRFYNGAMSTRHCRQLDAGLRYALSQDTRVLVVRSGDCVFSNGIHLGVIEAADDPAVEGWANIRAINKVCRRIITASNQVVIAAYAGNAGAGGAMLGLGADIVVARSGIVLNPYYEMGLYGSELHTYTLPDRVGDELAMRLTTDRLPVDTTRARAIGLIDAVGPREPEEFAQWLHDVAVAQTGRQRWRSILEAKVERARDTVRPLSYYETRELAEMARDMFDDRKGFAAARHAFMYKQKPTETPSKLALHRQPDVYDQLVAVG